MGRLISFFALFYLFCYNCPADTVIKYGSNVSKDNEKLGSTKALFVSQQRQWNPLPFVSQYEVGGWIDNSNINGRHSSGMISASTGVHVKSGPFFAQALVGPALITKIDSVLGGHFQFNNDVSFGLVDEENNATVGIAYKHISSAGLSSPNLGRDFLMFRLSLPWN